MVCTVYSLQSAVCSLQSAWSARSAQSAWSARSAVCSLHGLRFGVTRHLDTAQKVLIKKFTDIISILVLLHSQVVQARYLRSSMLTFALFIRNSSDLHIYKDLHGERNIPEKKTQKITVELQ